MRIHLTQDEIVAALKGYVNRQGINTRCKEITVDFTAGRKGTGISADLNIVATDEEEFDFPDLGEVEPPTLRLVTAAKVELPTESETAQEVQAQATVTDDASVFEGPVAEEQDDVVVEKPAPVIKPATTSLFAPR